MALESFKYGVASLALLHGCAASTTATGQEGGVDASVLLDTSTTDSSADHSISDVVHRDILPPLDVSLRRQLHLLLSGSSARPGSTVTAVAYLMNNARVVGDSLVRLQINGGGASLGVVGMRGYDRSQNDESTVTMDKVCYQAQGSTGDRYSHLLLPSTAGNGFGTVRLVRGSEPCPVTFDDSGLRTAKVYISAAISGTQVKSVRAVALSEADQPEDTGAVTVIDSAVGDLATIEARLSSEIVTPGGDTLAIIAARDRNGIGLPCVQSPPEADFQNATSTNREPVSTNTNGCTVERNSYAVPLNQTITINTSHRAPSTRGYLTVFSETATNLQVFARGQGITDSDDDWSLHALGNGMYVLPLRAYPTIDQGAVTIWYGNSTSSMRLAESVVQVSIE